MDDGMVGCERGTQQYKKKPFNLKYEKRWELRVVPS